MAKKKDNLTAFAAERGINLDIGGRAKSRRLELGLSQAEISRRVGIAQPTVSAIEIGAQVPSVVYGVIYAQTLQTTVEWFATGKRTPVTEARGQPESGALGSLEAATLDEVKAFSAMLAMGRVSREACIQVLSLMNNLLGAREPAATV